MIDRMYIFSGYFHKSGLWRGCFECQVPSVLPRESMRFDNSNTTPWTSKHTLHSCKYLWSEPLCCVPTLLNATVLLILCIYHLHQITKKRYKTTRLMLEEDVRTTFTFTVLGTCLPSTWTHCRKWADPRGLATWSYFFSLWRWKSRWMVHLTWPGHLDVVKLYSVAYY